MKYNIIGDVHGRKIWRNLVLGDAINVFVGDYFDPYDDISFEALRTEFCDILEYKHQHPETILLLGNHDLHYLNRSDSSRFDGRNANVIERLFLDNIHMFNGIAYAINDNILVSHAGVTVDWLISTDYIDEEDRNNIDSDMRKAPALAEWTNNLFWDGMVEADGHIIGWDHYDRNIGMYHFTFIAKAKFDDYYGTSPSQSPVWIRPQTLAWANAMPNGVQIIGHTQVHTILPEASEHLKLVDCLGREPASLIVDIDGENITYIANKPYELESLLV